MILQFLILEVSWKLLAPVTVILRHPKLVADFKDPIQNQDSVPALRGELQITPLYFYLIVGTKKALSNRHMYYRVPTISNLYLNVSKIIMLSLK